VLSVMSLAAVMPSNDGFGYPVMSALSRQDLARLGAQQTRSLGPISRADFATVEGEADTRLGPALATNGKRFSLTAAATAA
jgi:hypothetical protein